MIDSDFLKDFEWHRDRKGYRLWRDPVRTSLPGRDPPMTSLVGLVIVPKGEHSDWIKYQPFAGGGDLWKAFASVKSPDELLSFVNDHGPLTTDPSPRNPEIFAFAGESVGSILDNAKMFRELLRLKAQGNLRKLASYFESNKPAYFRFDDLIGRVELVGDSKTGLRLKMRLPDLLRALWYQLGLKLSKATLRTCPVCDKLFEVGAGTGLRADATFCCHDHKVDFFNRKRPRAIQRSKLNRR